MFSSPTERDMARVATTSLHHIAAAHRSCRDATNHVLSSRRAIEDSMELLSATSAYQTLNGPDLDESGAGSGIIDEAA